MTATQDRSADAIQPQSDQTRPDRPRPDTPRSEQRLLDRIMHKAGAGLSRRSMLRRSTMVATAMAVTPADFILRPKSAYAAICNCQGQGCPCGSMCCDGYSEFCCTLTGVNGCPTGTVAGGWWKVDGSNFCGGSPRYYMDCNSQCGGCGCGGKGICSGACSGTRCGCAKGNCNNRKSGCTNFRYGNCHQNVRCLGPIVCRIVTCTPPWQFDPSCSTASRTDNRTRNHTAACLNPFFGNIDAIVDVGGALKISGWLINRESQAPSSIKLFVDETPVVVTKTGVARPDVNKAYPNFPGNHGFEATIPAKAGRRVVCLYALQPGAKDTFITFKSQSVAGFLHGFDSVTTTPGVITTPDDETTPEDETVIDPAQIKVAGWVSDGRNFSQSAYVRVTINGVNKGTFIADSSRADVVKVYPCVTRRCGFNLSFPTEPGTYDVCVELDYRNGRTAPLGCKKVTVP